MAYFNWPNTDFYSNSTSGEYDGCLTQALVPEQVDVGIPETLTNGWIADDQQYYDDVARWPTSLRPETNFESTPCETQTQGYDQWVYPENYWPTTQRYAQPNHATQQYARPDYTTPSYDASADTATLEAPESTPALSNSEPSLLLRDFEESSAHRPQIDWEDDQSGQVTDTFCVNSQTPHRPSGSSIRTGSTKKRRHQPYAPPRAHPNDRTNAEAGPSNLAAPRIPNVALPPTDPPGGTSETTADAETTKTNTEENAAPAKRPRGDGRPRPGRDRHNQQLTRLCDWAQRRGTFPKCPTHRQALALALETVKALHPVPVRDKPSLGKCGSQPRKGKKRTLDAERESVRRKEIRGLYEELSKFYELPKEGTTWKCPRLLSLVLRDVESLPTPPATSFA